MLPASKAVPKELLPLADRPIAQYAVEEAVAAGVEHVVFVISEGKEALREHFSEPAFATNWLRSQGRDELAELSASPANLARFDFVYQREPKGIAHALHQAESLVAGEAIAVYYPDDVILGPKSALAELIGAYERRPGTILAVEEVPADQVSNYGVVDPSGEGDPLPLKGVVEKPPADTAPSRLAIVGRLILPMTIFDHIRRLTPGKGGEYQLTDAVALQIAAGEPVSAAPFSGKRFDTGRPPGYVAANVAAALIRPEFAEATRALIAPQLEDDE